MHESFFSFTSAKPPSVCCSKFPPYLFLQKYHLSLCCYLLCSYYKQSFALLCVLYSIVILFFNLIHNTLFCHLLQYKSMIFFITVLHPFQPDETPTNLMEMRFHIPASELAGEDPVEAFQQRVMEKASILTATGETLAIFKEVHCLTPRWVKASTDCTALNDSNLNSRVLWSIENGINTLTRP